MDELTAAANALSSLQTAQLGDKEDIVEFLNIRVKDHEKLIASLQLKIKDLECERKSSDEIHKEERLKSEDAAFCALESMTSQCQKLKVELTDVSKFVVQRDSLLTELSNIKITLESKENEYRNNVHGLERKILLDKTQMKKEMGQKISEALASFRKVANQQMAEVLDL